jgi:hypothetical protein
MLEAVEILDALQSRAFHLRIADNPAYNWIKNFQTTDVSGDDGENMLSTKNIIEVARPPNRHDDAATPSQPKSWRLPIRSPTTDATNSSATNSGTGTSSYRDNEESEDLDLIDLELRR